MPGEFTLDEYKLMNIEYIVKQLKIMNKILALGLDVDLEEFRDDLR